MQSSIELNDAICYRLRSDIQWTKIRGKSRSWWIATDPLRSQHFRCSEDERELLQLLGHCPTIATWKTKFLAKHPSASIEHADLQRLLHRFFEHGLLRSCAVNPNVNRFENGTSQPKAIGIAKQISTAIQHIEQLPWRLIQSRWSLGNPERFVNSIARLTSWLYSAPAVMFWLFSSVIVAAAIALQLLADADPIAWHPTQWLSSMEWNHIGNYVAILIVTRLFHELGHAIVAARMGVRVKNVGIFWMLGIACPYVDVTDSWRLSSRNQRIAVSLAGIYTEVIIATVAGVIWLNTAPNFLHSICGQIMILCSFMTIAINLNPLVRYDGYFVLSDYLEVANLRDDARFALRKLLLYGTTSAKAHGTSAITPSITFSDSAMAIFGLVSSLYRITIIISFAVAAITISHAWELDSIGIAMAACLMVCSFVLPSIRWSLDAIHRRLRVGTRLVLGCSMLVAILVYAAMIPIPSFVTCNGILGWSDQKLYYAKEYSKLVSTNPVQFDSSLLRLQNQSAIEQLKQIYLKIEQARLGMFHDSVSAYPIEDLALQAAIATEKQRRVEAQLASVRKPVDETATHFMAHPTSRMSTRWHAIELPPPELVDPITESGFGRPSRIESGYSIHDELNLGRWIAEGTPIGVLIQGDRVRVTATIDEDALSQIHIGTLARVVLAPYPTQVFGGRVTSISDVASLEIGQASSRSKVSSIPPRPNLDVDARDTWQTFGIVIEIDNPLPDDQIESKIDKKLFGASASVVLDTKPKSIFDRVCSYIKKVIRH